MSKENGRFEKGNEIGKDTRFQQGHHFSNKYKAEYCDQMLEYFRNTFAGYPTFELFADSINVTEGTLHNWKEKHPQFATVYEHCRTIQKGKLITGGLAGAYNAQIVKFIATNHHGMSEKSVNDTTVKFSVQLPDEIDEESN